MTRTSRVRIALPTVRDLRAPEAAKSFAAKTPVNWVWVAFQNRKQKPLSYGELGVIE